MRRIRKVGVTLGVVVLLAGCTPALSDEAACEEINKYAGELSSTIRNMTENISEPSSLAVYSNRLVEISDEVGELNIADEEISDAVVDWVATSREIGVFFSDGWELGDDADQILPTFDRFQIANNKMIRLCDL